MNAEKPVEEMDVREVFILIEKHFNTEVAEKFEAQKVDGKTLVLSKRASQEQYEACGLLTVADQLKLSSVVNSSAESGSTGFEVTTIKPKKPSKAQLLQISETARRIYKTKRKAIRTAAINRWPGNDIPNFKKNKVAVDELNDLVNDLKEDCSFPPLNFGKEGIKQHILDVLNERRRHKRKGHDYSQPDKRTLKRKVDQGTSSDSTSTDNDIGSSSSASGSSADHEEIGDSEETNNSGDTESVEESDENEDHLLEENVMSASIPSMENIKTPSMEKAIIFNSRTMYHCIDDYFVITIYGIFLINIYVFILNSQ